jgi:hypothetical protein
MRRARVRIITYILLVAMALAFSHFGMIISLRLIESCLPSAGTSMVQSFLPVVSLLFIAYSFVRAWIEFIRLVYTRWLRGDAFSARVGLPPAAAPETLDVATKEHWWMLVAAGLLSAGMIGCLSLHPSNIMDRGSIAALLVCMFGFPGSVYGAWYYRTLEPYMPFE